MFLIFLVLAKILGPEIIGLMALAELFVCLANTFIIKGLPDYIIQQHEMDNDRLDAVFYTGLGFGIVLTLLLMLLSRPVADYFGYPLVEKFLFWLSFLVLINAFRNVPYSLFTRNLTFKYLAISSVSGWLIAGITSIIIAHRGYYAESIISLHLIRVTIETAIIWIKTDWRPRLKIPKTPVGKLLVFSANIIGVELLNIGNRRIADLIIGYSLGPVLLGYYYFAYRICFQAVDLLVGTISTVTLPLFSRIQHDIPLMRKTLYNVIRQTTLFTFPAFILCFSITHEFVHLFFGEKWLQGAPVLQVLFIITLLYSLTYFNGTVIIAKGKPSWRLCIQSIQFIANITGILIGVNSGITCVSILYVAAGYLVAPLSFYAVKKLIGIEIAPYSQILIKPFAASIIMAGLVYTVKISLYNLVPDIYLFGILVFTGLFSYMIVINRISGINIPAQADTLKTVIFGVKGLKK